jgi:hypothetical protein
MCSRYVRVELNAAGGVRILALRSVPRHRAGRSCLPDQRSRRKRAVTEDRQSSNLKQHRIRHVSLAATPEPVHQNGEFVGHRGNGELFVSPGPAALASLQSRSALGAPCRLSIWCVHCTLPGIAVAGQLAEVLVAGLGDAQLRVAFSRLAAARNSGPEKRPHRGYGRSAPGYGA